MPAPPSSRRSPLRHGLGWTVGALLALALGWAARTVAHELLLIVPAAFIAIGLDPAVAFLVRCGLRRTVAVAVIALVALAALAGFVADVAPALAQQGTELASQAPAYLQQLNDHSTVLGRLNNQCHLVAKLKAQASGGASLAAGGVLHAGTVLISATLETVIVLVLVIYFLADLGQIKHGFYRLFPRHRRPRVGLLGEAILARVGGYVLGNVLTSIVATIGNYLVLLTLHVPHALALSILVGVLDLIPLVRIHRRRSHRRPGRPGRGLRHRSADHRGLSRAVPGVRGLPAQPPGAAQNRRRQPTGHHHRGPAQRFTAWHHWRPDRRPGRSRGTATAHRSALHATRQRHRTDLTRAAGNPRPAAPNNNTPPRSASRGQPGLDGNTRATVTRPGRRST